MAVSNVGLGIKGRIADFNDGWAFKSDVSSGRSDWGGRLAAIRTH